MPRAFLLAAIVGAITMSLPAESSAQSPLGARPPEFVTPEVSPDRKIAFRLHAPKAQAVRLASSDLPDIGQGAEMAKGENGVWQATVGPVPAGAYRYHFTVDDVAVADPRNPATSETNTNVESLAYVPGSEAFDLKEVPHGAVAEVAYYSQTLKRHRRMHVYTPPGYEKGSDQYPVFYLLHGAFDCDDAWSTVGLAGIILDNLIAAGKARPMIVVMPAGHTGPFRFGPPGDRSLDRQIDEFCEDFSKDLRPHVEKNYRIKADRAHRAIAGLSMGGSQTLNIAFANLNDYGYVGVYSSGVFGIAGGFGGATPNKQWEASRKETLDNVELKKGLRLVWFGIGKDDFLLSTSRATVSMLKSHGFEVAERETDGGHTWLVWRDYLHEFAPKLFTIE